MRTSEARHRNVVPGLTACPGGPAAQRTRAACAAGTEAVNSSVSKSEARETGNARIGMGGALRRRPPEDGSGRGVSGRV
ncbi:hypothetical protein [Streptomyces sp. 061-3]|uniref:hypothetical protein n=1 Tax=Streptomyces sp. 061-3 TaxID=2789268 RepID=UPI003980B21B